MPGRSVLYLLVVACGVACGADDTAEAAAQERSTPQRIVSLSPATTELLFAIGAGGRVVGRTRFDDDPPEARDVPSVGDGLQPNVEVVLATRPDLVLFYSTAANTPAMQRLEEAGVAVASLRIDALDDFTQATRRLGRMLDVEVRAESLITAFETELARVSRRGQLDVRAAILAWTEPPIVIGRSSFLSEIVEHAGAVNVFADVEQASAPVSIEVIAARRPDLIVVGPGAAEVLRGRPEWQTVEAVRADRIIVVSGSQFSHPSFRAVAAIRELQTLLKQAGF